jgi:hypothetical protein
MQEILSLYYNWLLWVKGDVALDFHVEWGTIIFSFPILAVAIWGGVKYFAKKYVDQHFNEKLENHKHELQQITEFNKFDMQRKFQDFTLFTTKRHEAYVVLYDLYLTAEGMSRGLMGFRQVPDYIRYNAKELEHSLKARGLSQVKIEQFVESWDNEKEHKVDELKEYIQSFEIRSAMDAATAVSNKYLISRLYLSDEVSTICETLTKAIRGYNFDLENFYDKNYPIEERRRVRESMSKNETQIEQSLQELKEQMQKELSVGYYDKASSEAE